MESKTISRIMGSEHEEFYRLIGKTLQSTQTLKVNKKSAKFCITSSEGTIRIHLEQVKRKKLGALQLPETVVNFEFKGLTENSIQSYMRRFDMTFQRGGG